MSAPALLPSEAEIRRAKAVGEVGRRLGLAFVPGVVLADVAGRREGDLLRLDSEIVYPWLSPGGVLVQVWGGKPVDVWRTVQDATQGQGLALVLQVWPVTRWARVRAWWRVVTWPLVRWLERRAGL